MALDIATNMGALETETNLASSSAGLQTEYQRLSSGLRINTAADDAAGLAIAENLNADTRVAAVAIRNANDGVSIISITDGAIGQITNILDRLAELASQSANGVYSNGQRSALALEYNALSSEIERIAITTTFNGLDLLSGGGSVTFQVGFDGSSNSTITYNGVAATLQSMGLAAAGSSVPLYSIISDSVVDSQSAAQQALDAINAAITSLTRNRGTLGAAESRLETSINNLQIESQNDTNAESQIMDADVAQESSQMTRLTILQQAGVAVLAQANQQPALALRLLQS